MREQFAQHFDTFTLLEKMQKEDEKFSSIADTWTEIAVPPDLRGSIKNYDQDISEERWNYYRELFAQAGTGSGMRRHYTLGRGEVRDVKFFLSVSNFGFTYVDRPPAKVFESFNACRAIKFDDKYRCYVFLREKWYLHMGVNNEPV